MLDLEAESSPRWNLPTRFFFLLSLCYLLPTAIRAMFFDIAITNFFLHGMNGQLVSLDPWQLILPWVNAHIFHVSADPGDLADADGKAGILLHAAELALALLAASLWTFLDRKRPNYRKLYFWFALYLRFVLASTLFSYGFDKVYPLQFGNLTASRLVPQVGDLSPFELIWTLMAASKPYTIFSGALELVAGALLLIPRIEMLGSMLSIIVLSNIVALNLTYEIPVKIFSSHLLLISIFLAAPALLRMVQLLVLQTTPAPFLPAPQFNRPWIQKAQRFAPTVLVVLSLAFFVFMFAGSRARYQKDLETSAKAATLPFHGVWEVDSFTLPQAGPQGAQPALFTRKLAGDMHIAPGEDQWIRLFFERPKSLEIQLKNHQLDFVDMTLDPATGKAQITDSGDLAWKGNLTLKLTGPNSMNIDGTINNVPISAKLHHLDTTKFRLTRDGR